MASSPYVKLPPRAFWRMAISDVHYADLKNLWEPLPLQRQDKIATAGSCFAQHIGNNLARRGANFMNLEPPPPALFSSTAEARRFGYQVYSCRYGNVYTARQLVQLFEEAFDRRRPAELAWARDGRHYDALRPSVDPIGQADAGIIVALRKAHLARVRQMFETLDLFVFTLGLTEAWLAKADGTAYPTAPGTICGDFDSSRYEFRNFGYPEIAEDMHRFWTGLRSVNPRARLLLTVSPVPLTATASGDHVLVATTYSKSVLRAVAGDLSRAHADIHYFPSFEIISSHPSRGMFYDPNLRTVNEFGVNYVMSHFFSGKLADEFATATAPASTEGEANELICDEEALDRA